MRDPCEEAVREHLNAIRARGPGSRGGKGARKRRNGGKNSTRRLSARESKRAATTLAAITEGLQGKFTDNQVQAAKQLLTERFDVDHISGKTTPGAFWRRIVEAPQKQFIIKGDEQYRRAIEYVFSLFIYVASSGMVEMHTNIMLEKLADRQAEEGKKPRRAQIKCDDDLIRLIARLTIDFGLEPQADDRGKVWFLAAAIRHFMELGKGPDEIEAHYQEKGGGLDSWARLAPKTVTSEKKELAVLANVTTEDAAPAIDTSHYDDDETDGDVHWADVAIDNKSIPELENILLRMATNNRRVQPGDLLLLAVTGDRSARLKARVVLDLHLTDTALVPQQLQNRCDLIGRLAQRIISGQASKPLPVGKKWGPPRRRPRFRRR